MKISTEKFDGVSSFPPSAREAAGNYTSYYASHFKDYNCFSSETFNLPSAIPGFTNDEACDVVYTYTDPQLGPIKAYEVFISSNGPSVFYDLNFLTHPAEFSVYKNTFKAMVKSFQSVYDAGDV